MRAAVRARRCARACRQSFSLTLLIACLAVFLATAVGESVVHRRHLSWMTESGVAIIVGLAIGFVFFLYEMLTTNDQTQLDAASRRLEFLEFDPVFFTLVLLPPIIFESGYNLNHSFFFSNLGGILALAFAGTLIATGVTAFSLYWGLGGPQGLLTPMESAAFAALISAVDPVATLAIFSSTGADPKLNALIFGESVLNDAVAIVLFKTLVEMGVSTNLGIGGWEAMTAASVFSVVGKFLLIFCGSLLVGVCSGMATALAFKLLRLRDLHADSAAPAELICLVCLSYAAFMLAELGGLSGIVSALFSGAVSVTFVQHNLTPEGAALCKTAVKTLARFTETIVFLLIGTGFWLYTLGSVERGPANATAAADHAEEHARRVALRHGGRRRRVGRRRVPRAGARPDRRAVRRADDRALPDRARRLGLPRHVHRQPAEEEAAPHQAKRAGGDLVLGTARRDRARARRRLPAVRRDGGAGGRGQLLLPARPRGVVHDRRRVVHRLRDGRAHEARVEPVRHPDGRSNGADHRPCSRRAKKVPPSRRRGVTGRRDARRRRAAFVDQRARAQVCSSPR